LANERSLVEQAKVDIDAFTELYRHYLPRIYSFAWRRTGSAAAAEDVCASTFEAALKSIHRFTWGKGGLAPWLYRIAANESVSHHRRERRPTGDRGQQAMANMHTASTSFEPEDIAGLTDDHGALRHALDSLNPRYQRAVALRYLADLTPQEAALAMGVSRPAYSVVLSRAMSALRKSLEIDPTFERDHHE